VDPQITSLLIAFLVFLGVGLSTWATIRGQNRLAQQVEAQKLAVVENTKATVATGTSVDGNLSRMMAMLEESVTARTLLKERADVAAKQVADAAVVTQIAEGMRQAEAAASAAKLVAEAAQAPPPEPPKP
jgi:hypothetical protein